MVYSADGVLENAIGLTGYENFCYMLADDRELATPRLLGINLAGATGMPLLLMSALAGSSKIPEVASITRLRTLGLAAAELHKVALTPRAGLPVRLRPVADVDFAVERRPTGSLALLEAAAGRLQQLSPPAGPTVFVHGDFWQGNTVWTGDRLVGIVDWEEAGTGHPGVDLGWLRLDATLLFGPAAAAEIVDGWRRATGYEPDALAYWDVVAALNSPVDLAAWLPPFRRQGRSDLDAATLTGRRDAFLCAALDRLGRPRTNRHQDSEPSPYADPSSTTVERSTEGTDGQSVAPSASDFRKLGRGKVHCEPPRRRAVSSRCLYRR